MDCNQDCSASGLNAVSPSPPPPTYPSGRRLAEVAEAADSKIRAGRGLNHQNVPAGQRRPLDYTFAELNALDCRPAGKVIWTPSAHLADRLGAIRGGAPSSLR